MATKRIEERIQFSGGKVCREGDKPFIDGVLLCGASSANNRDYAKEAFEGDRAARYEGRPVHVNHTNERTVEGKLGWISNVTRRASDGMPVGRLNVNPKHPLAESVLWAAEHNPSFYGMSHVAHCRTKAGANGRELVEEILSVESVDIVAEPATTKGLYEQTGGRAVAKIKLTKLIECLAAKVKLEKLLKLKTLSEMDGMADTEVAEPGESDPDEAIEAAFVSAMHKLIDCYAAGECDAKDLVAKLKTVLTAHGKLTDEPPPTKEPPPEDKKGEESKKAGTGDAIKEALKVCEKVNWKGFTADDLDTLASLPAAKREAVAGKLKLTAVGGPEKPESSAQGDGVKPVTEAAKIPEPGTPEYARWLST